MDPSIELIVMNSYFSGVVLKDDNSSVTSRFCILFDDYESCLRYTNLLVKVDIKLSGLNC